MGVAQADAMSARMPSQLAKVNPLGSRTTRPLALLTARFIILRLAKPYAISARREILTFPVPVIRPAAVFAFAGCILARKYVPYRSLP